MFSRFAYLDYLFVCFYYFYFLIHEQAVGDLEILPLASRAVTMILESVASLWRLNSLSGSLSITVSREQFKKFSFRFWLILYTFSEPCIFSTFLTL